MISGSIVNIGDNTYISLMSEDEVEICNSKYSKVLKQLIELKINVYKSALKTYQYVIDLEQQLSRVCSLAIETVNACDFKAVKCFAGNLFSNFETVTCISI